MPIYSRHIVGLGQVRPLVTRSENEEEILTDIHSGRHHFRGDGSQALIPDAGGLPIDLAWSEYLGSEIERDDVCAISAGVPSR